MIKLRKLFIIPVLSTFAVLTSCNDRIPKTPTTKEWYADSTYINGLEEKDIGTIKEIKVNNVTHQVRLIGIDHDIDANGNKLHTTWEFANLISDSEGYSFGYQIRDVHTDKGSNQDYINSSIRKILCGNGDFATDVYCATRASAHDSDATKNNWDFNYTNKTVLSMMPADFQKALKTTKKTVRSGTDYKEIQEYTDKLFLLSSNEIGNKLDEDEGTTYSYYKNASSTSSIRKKHQVKDNAEVLQNIRIDPNDKVTVCKQFIFSYAGFKSSSQNEEGAYWLSSPYCTDTDNSFSCYCNGSGIINGNYSNCYAYGIAPAFCI